MKTFLTGLLSLFILLSSAVRAQHHSAEPAEKKQAVVLITGVRFAYPLVQQWIDDYHEVNPDVQFVIESRGSSDPAQYDILVEAYEHPDEIKTTREYIYVARYAVLPVANSRSAFARIYADKGLDTNLIRQLFFHDLYADKRKEQEVKAPYTVYTRLQRAGVPIVFTRYFGYAQKDIGGKAVAGSDAHLLKALLRDSTAVSYLPLALIYDHDSQKPVDGLTVLPVDIDGNGRVTEYEKFYSNAAQVVQRLEERLTKDLHNIPVEYIHLSVDKAGAGSEAVAFLQWVSRYGADHLHAFGYLLPEPRREETEKFEQFASRRLKQ